MNRLDEETFRMKLELDERKRGFIEGGAPAALALERNTKGPPTLARTVRAVQAESGGTHAAIADSATRDSKDVVKLPPVNRSMQSRQ